MRRAIFLAAAALLFSLSAGVTAKAQTQESYAYTVTTRTRTLLMNWRPEKSLGPRYTLSVSPLRLASSGLKFDFEFELPRPGHWLGTSVVGYLASPRNSRYDYWDHEGNNRASFNSGWDDYHRMWGIGTSAIYKRTFSRRGWYWSAGVVFEYFEVGIMEGSYIPYVENGLTFYDYGRTLENKSYYKPTVQVKFGKHIALSRRLYFDLYAGLGLSYALYKDDGRHNDAYGSGYYTDSQGNRHEPYYPKFSEGGFAHRGVIPVGGFRFGVLLWPSEKR